ncbi:phosphoadenylyl-sulfate reductase [Variovorax sp. PBL-E5]|uniref:phosphoadenylyl-sulfate reductase n=1 Tax=Variovorax sp. PBL-E5 TaxID=434014 RepID=UPI001318D083|nr:phosphoadenylyl-sulfate reductase [Variovorax sp. PBL-E5]VTU29363.1 Phosphoadenosine phosphosulfate reductase [Variovorax sp. PBL-E5]
MNAISLYAKASADFDAKLAESVALLRRAADEFAPITQASSLGAEDMVVTDLLQRHGIASGIFVLETGKLHAETLGLLDALQTHYGRQVDIYRPVEAAAAAFVAANGEEAMYRSLDLRKACCHIRKMEPLERALAGRRGWITGLRREQSGARAEVEFIEQQPERVKVNPLARWTWGDVWHYIALHEVPYNPLHDQFYPSIGCAPCTRAVTLGEDFRSGRWWWEQESAKECGLHVAADGSHEGEEPAAFESPSAVSAVSPLSNRAIPIRAIPN